MTRYIERRDILIATRRFAPPKGESRSPEYTTEKTHKPWVHAVMKCAICGVAREWRWG